MTSLQRLGLEAFAGVVLLGGFVGWWQLHDHAERKIGAAQCIQSTAEVASAAVRDDTSIEAAHAAQLSKVVAVYETKLADSAGANADLARRLHDDALRQSALPGPRGAPRAAAGAGAIPGGAGGAQTQADPFGIDSATQALIEACASDANELTALQEAWASQLRATPYRR